ncbi:hypothetical protein WA026_009512 [Henosepilachna vigintioctopunctata]|uniref:Uncharacterized protein n=1 Tax=Henosepilachna vigintioctopunctata TaxID=420089 RepID=A0AAW1U441_9CUCU
MRSYGYTASCATISTKSAKSSKLYFMLALVNTGEFGRYVSVHDSDKKTAKGIHDLLEFNSVWLSCGSDVKAKNKWSMASLLLESGAPIRECFLIQLFQVVIVLMTHGLFPTYNNRIVTNPDPNILFFLLDHPVLAGIMGFDFNNCYQKLFKAAIKGKFLSRAKSQETTLISLITRDQWPRILLREIQAPTSTLKTKDSKIKSIRESLKDLAWENAISIIPCLRETVSETVKEVPFDTHTELHSYISRVRSETRSFNLTCAPERGISQETTLISLIRRDQWPRILLIEIQAPASTLETRDSKIKSIR